LARSVGYDVAAMQSRRERRGIGRADTARAVLTWPWYLVRGVIGVVPAVLVAASAIVVVGGVGWWLVDSGRLVVAAPPEGEAPGALAGNAAWVAVALLAAAVLIGLLIVWFGPMSRTTRTGARWALAAVAPGPVGAVVVTLLALAAAAFLITLALAGQDVVWWPLPGPPELRAGS
ncbi:MAG: serine/threonine protein kinase, partial [Cellulomonadaceae bacterium]|nr:serine/threonine protein kinase [Cellulomonadaceae bacterium]